MVIATEHALRGQLGEFDPVRVLARGGMGVVYEVKSETTGESFAAKLCRRPDHRARFQREALIHSRCDRVLGVAKLLRYGETPHGVAYMIFELAPKGSLDRTIAIRGRLETAHALAIARALAETLGEVHSRGIVHRDVKPGNVLLDERDSPRLTDFGLAKSQDLAPLELPTVFVGTPSYCSPEQVFGDEVGPPSDVFGVGCVLFEMLTRENPFAAGSMKARLARMRDSSVRCRLQGSGVPDRVAAVVERSLRLCPDERPANGSELAAFLADAAASI